MSRRETLAARYGQEVVDNLELLVGYCDEATRLAGLGREALLDDFILQRASEAILNRIGDTVGNRLPDELLDEYPGPPWRLVVSQRVLAAHVYHSLDYRIIWTTFTEHIPPLRAYVVSVILGEARGR